MSEIEIIIDRENLVTKSNLLIEAAYKLTTSEFKLIQTIFSNIQPNDTKTHTYTFPIRQFIDLLELKGQSSYSELKRITLDLYKKPISITINGETTQITWFSLVHYNEYKGTITIEIHQFWDKYLLSLTNNFTSYKLFNITNLRSIYSLRLYELLKSRINLNSTRVISLQELRTKMGIASEQYPKYSNFKQRVILQAQKELKEQSDIYFDFVEIKKGRAVDKIEFHIHRNVPKKMAIEQLPNDIVPEKQNNLTEFGLKTKVIAEINSKYSKEQIDRNIAYTKEKMSLGDIKNPPAYIIKAIQDDYAASIKELPKKVDKQDEILKNLQVNNELVIKERFDKPVEEIEYHLLNVKEVKESLNVNEEEIKNEIYQQLMAYVKYQEETYEKLVSPKKFKNEYIQNICKEVLVNIYSSV